MSLESYLDTSVQMAGNPDWDVEYTIGKRRCKLALKLARMDDYDLGQWLVSNKEDTSREVEDAVLLIGQDRLAEVLDSMLDYTSVERLLVDAAKTFLEETQEEVSVEMPEELNGIDDDEKLSTELYRIGDNDRVANALIVLSSEDRLRILLESELLVSYNVAMILVGFYEELMDD